MSTSTEQINDLIDTATDLVTTFQAEEAALKAARENLPASIFKTYYVDEINGLPGNAGTSAAPFALIDDAIAALKVGQVGLIYLKSDAVWRKRYASYGASLRIVGLDVTRQLTFADEAENEAGKAPGLVSQAATVSVTFQKVNVVLNENFPVDSSVFLPVAGLSITLNASFIDGTNCNGFLVGAFGGPASIQLQATVATAMAGRWLQGFPASTAMTADATGAIIDPAIAANT